MDGSQQDGLVDVVVIGLGLVVMLLTNALLIRWALAPLQRLISRLEGIDDLAPTRLPEEGSGPVRGIAEGVNGLMARLREERRLGDARALSAQEAERHRIAQELHDEVGQSLTVVLLGLKQVESQAPAELVSELAAVRAQPFAPLSAAQHWDRETPRPARLFRRPEPVEDVMALTPDDPPSRFRWRGQTIRVRRAEGPERIGEEWWRNDFKLSTRTFRQPTPEEIAQSNSKELIEEIKRHHIPARDYFIAEDENGHRFWLFREDLYTQTISPNWFLHGLFE